MSATPRHKGSGPKPRQEPDPDRELVLVLERVRLRARLRAAWLRHVWTKEGEPGGRFGVTHAEADAVISDADSPAAEAAWVAGEAPLARVRRRLAAVEAGLAKNSGGRLALLDRLFGFTAGDMDLLHGCLAAAADPGITRLYAYLQDHSSRAYMTEELAVRLFGYRRSVPWGTDSAPFRWELIAERDAGPGEPRILSLDPQIRDWIAGRHELDRTLVGIAQLHAPRTPLHRWPVRRVSDFLIRAATEDGPVPVRVIVRGSRGTGRRTLAATVASEVGLHLLAVDAEAIEERHWGHVFLRAQRQAYLDVTALAWHGGNLSRRVWPKYPLPFPVQFVILEQGEVLPSVDGVVDYAVEMPPLTAEDRQRLWQEYLPASADWPPSHLTTVSDRYQGTAGEIVAAAKTGVATPQGAADALRTTGRGRLGELAQHLECPFTWDDLIVSDHVRATLADFVFEAGARGAFWEQPRPRRMFPQGRALIALLAGDPGVGKTMAAQVIAAALGLDLYRIDLSAVISKWVGETSQNIDRLLRRAAEGNVVLLFDEADALYSKRTTEMRDAQDRYVAMDTAHLMVAIENYSGVVVLSTNLKNNIDPAFLRRVRYVVDFARPDASQRVTIWSKVVTALAGEARAQTLEPDLQRLATAVDATGSQLKYAVLSATFMAARRGAPLAADDLVRGLNRELAKEGRVVSTREQGRLLGHAV